MSVRKCQPSAAVRRTLDNDQEKADCQAHEGVCLNKSYFSNFQDRMKRLLVGGEFGVCPGPGVNIGD